MPRLPASPRRRAAARDLAAPRASAAPRTRAAALAAILTPALLAGLAGCRAGQVIEECPGVPVATLDLAATRTSASCQGDTAPADGTAACAAGTPPLTVNCLLDRPVPPCCFDGLFKPEVEFRATFAFGSTGSAASFCLPVPGATPYPGSHAAVAGGDQVSVSLETIGAVLASCSATCAVTMRHEVSGLLGRDPVTGDVTGFTGESVELASPTPDATCTPCTAPCTATWSLAPKPPAP